MTLRPDSKPVRFINKLLYRRPAKIWTSLFASPAHIIGDIKKSSFNAVFSFWHWHLEWFDSTTLHKYGMMCKSYRGIRTVIWYFYFTNVHYFNLALPWLPKLISLSVNYYCNFINDWLKFHINPIIGADWISQNGT